LHTYKHDYTWLRFSQSENMLPGIQHFEELVDYSLEDGKIYIKKKTSFNDVNV